MKKEIILQVSVPMCIFDIDNKTHILGDARRRAGDTKIDLAAWMQTNKDTAVVAQLLRGIDNSLRFVKNEISDYINEDITTANNAQQTDDAYIYSLVLRVPSNFNSSMVGTLTAEIHQYIVNRNISEWYILQKRDEADVWGAYASANIANIHKAINRRNPPVMPTYKSVMYGVVAPNIVGLTSQNHTTWTFNQMPDNVDAEVFTNINNVERGVYDIGNAEEGQVLVVLIPNELPYTAKKSNGLGSAVPFDGHWSANGIPVTVGNKQYRVYGEFLSVSGNREIYIV